MFIIVGLGNPTRQYEGTKHNVGFDTIDYLIDEYQIPSSGAGHKALFGKGMIAGQKVIVAKPMTYMNLSGESVRELVNYYKVDPESELIVVYDDISLAPGQIRIRIKRSVPRLAMMFLMPLWPPALPFLRIRICPGARLISS